MSQDIPADLIFRNGRVHGQGGVAAALATRGERIVAIGSDDRIERLRGPDTTVFDLGGRSLLPGFNDMHAHPIFAGLRMTQCRIPQGSDWAGLCRAVSQHVATLGQDDWITGGQWDASTLGRAPTLAALDRISDGRPLYLNDTSGHSAVANSLALDRAGVSADTPDPDGGIIERDASGTPTGVLRERALELVERVIPKPDHQSLRAAILAGHAEMLRLGYTACTDASIGMVAGAIPELEAYAELYDEGRLPQRTRLFLIWEPEDAAAERLIEGRTRYARDRIDVDCIKIHLDGVPTDGQTAAMVDAYLAPPEGRDDAAGRHGLLLQNADMLNAALARFDAAGLVVKYHAVGDRAVRQGLDAIAFARWQNGPDGRRHEIGHATFVHPDDLSRAVDLGAVWELSPYLFCPSPITDDILRAVGPERCRHAWPFNSLLATGAPVVAGSDWPVIDDPNPWRAIETLVTRQAPGGSDDTFGAAEAISLDAAIDTLTRTPAEVLGQGDDLGRLAPGYLADFIVLDRDPHDLDPRELHRIRTEATIIGGKIAWSSLGGLPSTA